MSTLIDASYRNDPPERHWENPYRDDQGLAFCGHCGDDWPCAGSLQPPEGGAGTVNCKHCGKEIEVAHLTMESRTYRHADSPHTYHCIIDGRVAATTAEPDESN